MDTNRNWTITAIDPAEAPMDLLLEADPSPAQIESYLFRSRCYAARNGNDIIGIYVILDRGNDIYELMNIAVDPSWQGKGLGSQLLRHAISTARQNGARRLEVGTGTFGHQLAYYQKAGFRAFAVDRDFFLRHYPEPVFENGLQHKDMLRFAIEWV